MSASPPQASNRVTSAAVRLGIMCATAATLLTGAVAAPSAQAAPTQPVTPAAGKPAVTPKITARVPNYYQWQCSRFTWRCRNWNVNPPRNPNVPNVQLAGTQWVWVWF